MPVSKKPLLAGSTIIEVVTGMFLISLAITLTAVVFSKTLDNMNLYVKHKAVLEINKIIIQQANEKNYLVGESDSGNILILVSSLPFPGSDSLQIITYLASEKSTGKQLYTRKLIKRH